MKNKKHSELMHKLAVTREVASELSKNGFSVIDIKIDNDTTPTILIAYSKLCSRLGGFVCRHFHDDKGHQQEFETQFAGVRVCWTIKTEGILDSRPTSHAERHA